MSSEEGKSFILPGTSLDSEECLESFQQLLRIRTVSNEGPRSGSYQECCDWLSHYLREVLQFDHVEIIEVIKDKPIVLASWYGTEPELPTVLLNSHYDVVPANEDYWTVPPFAAERKDGKIYGRGTQDMKCVCMQYLLALKELKMNQGYQPRRTIHVTYVPDEEIGGQEGMAAFLETDKFKSLNVNLALDEGIANPNNEYTFFYGEKMPLWIRVRAEGNTGHGSRFIKGTAVEKLMKVMNKAMEYRYNQEKLLGHDESGCKHSQAYKLGDIVSINMTVLKAGVSADGGNTFSFNVIPTNAECGFDVRVPPTIPQPEIAKMLDSWCGQDEGVTWEFAKEAGDNPILEHHFTDIDKEKNPWYKIFSETLTKTGVPLEPAVFPASTDMRFVRAHKIPAFGFSPMRNTEQLLHEHDEYIGEEMFLEGIGTYITLIPALASAEKFENLEEKKV